MKTIMILTGLAVLIISNIAWASKNPAQDLQDSHLYAHSCIYPAIMKTCKKYIPAKAAIYDSLVGKLRNKLGRDQQAITRGKKIVKISCSQIEKDINREFKKETKAGTNNAVINGCQRWQTIFSEMVKKKPDMNLLEKLMEDK